MIKDVIVNLALNKSRDSVRDYAITVARTFDAHLAGVAFTDGANLQFSLRRNFLLPLLRTSWPKIERLHAARSNVSRRRSGAAFFPSSIDWLKRPPHFRKWRAVTI